MKRRGRVAWIAVPLAALAWPLAWSSLFPQQGGAPQSSGGQSASDDEETADQELAPLVSELAGAPQKTNANYGVAERPESAPTLVSMRDGGAWLVALEWEPGAGDRIIVRALTPAGMATKTLVVDATPHEILRPVAIEDAQGRLVVAWTETTDAGPQLKMARLEGEKFTAPATLTEPAMLARNVELALHDGSLWCCFESHVAPLAGSDKGIVDVLLAPVIHEESAGEKLGAPIRVGDGRFTDCDPVAASSGGKLWVAWSQYAGRDYEIELRACDPKSGALDPAIDVSADSESDDLHPSLLAGVNGELWLAWDRLLDPTRGSSMPRSLRDAASEEACSVHVMTACIRGGKVLLPEGRRGLPPGVVVGVPQFSWTGGMPRLALDPRDATGRPWLAYRYLTYGGPTGDRFGYANVLHHWNGFGWSAPVPFEKTIGPMEQPALCAMKGGALVAWQKDRRFELANQEAASHLPASMKKALDAAHFESRGWVGEAPIVVASSNESALTGGAVEGAKLVERVERLSHAHYHPAADPIDDPYVTGARHFVVEQGEKKWQVYWGDLHRHSCVSRCSKGMEERPLQRWDFGRDVHLYDFMALTDHSGQIDPVSWWLEDKLVRLERAPDFCTLAGYEWSSTAYGHQNVILAGRLDPVVMTFCKQDELNRKLSAVDAIAIPHGTADQGRSAEIRGWDDRMVRLVEVYQAMRGNSEFEGCVRQSKRARVDDCFVQDALNDGHKFGLIASTDHGNGASYAVALAEHLDVKSLMEAFHARRTYAATTKGMLVDFRIDGHLMGEECECAAAPKLHFKVRGAAELGEAVVYRDGTPVFALGRKLKEKGDATELSKKPVDVAIRLELTQNPKDGDEWRLKLKAPGCELERNGSSAGLHRYHPNPPYPRWRTKEDVATFVWPDTFDPDEVDHQYRLDLHGPLDTKLELEWGAERKELALAALIDAPLEGSTPRGSFRITATEPPDAQVDLAKGLGTRELEQEWSDEKVAAGKHWYYVRAIQKDGEIVWSSPIFVTRK